jgi:hypothetical protein
MLRNALKKVTVTTVDCAKARVANSHHVSQHDCKHWLEVARRATDGLKHLRRSSLLLQRFREVGCAFGEVCSALTEFVEQPRILNGDNGLSGEVSYKLHLLVIEGTNFLTRKHTCANQFVLF